MNESQPRIDFYVLGHHQPQGRAFLCCRLTEKAVAQGHQVYIHLENQEQLRHLDDLLWTFRDRSFIPHCVYSGPESTDEPVMLGHGEAIPEKTDVLINLTGKVPVFYRHFTRIVEIVDPDERVRALARTRFLEYRSAGCEPHTHRL